MARDVKDGDIEMLDLKRKMRADIIEALIYENGKDKDPLLIKFEKTDKKGEIIGYNYMITKMGFSLIMSLTGLRVTGYRKGEREGEVWVQIQDEWGNKYAGYGVCTNKEKGKEYLNEKAIISTAITRATRQTIINFLRLWHMKNI